MARFSSLWRSLQSTPYPKIFTMVLGVAIVVILNTVGSAQEVCNYHPEAYEGLNPSVLEAELGNTGLVGRMHGAASNAKLYVLSVREPENFFSHREYSLVPKSTSQAQQFSQLARHDLVCVQGSILPNPSPQDHIRVSSLRLLDTWNGLDGYPEYEHQEGIPEELKQTDNFVGKIHAIGSDGKVLVVEYKDAVLPVFIPSSDIARDLYRGDVVRLSYTIQSSPNHPTHLRLDSAADSPVEVISSIAEWHEQPMTLSGHLVKFPQSPQISLDVFALEIETEGVNRYFTLVNFDDLDEFQRIQDKLARIWDNHAEESIRGRNALVEPTVCIEATGTINVMSPEQANPQILIDSREDLRVKARRTADS